MALSEEAKTKIAEIKSKLKKDDRIVFLGGAGVSTASGIPDFRSPQGLYNVKSKYGAPYEVMLSHSYFEAHTETFYDFYWSTMVNAKAKPNKAHLVLADYERRGGHIEILTQNIDGLHTVAGSKHVYELHGTVQRYHCVDCYKEYSLSELTPSGVPVCKECGGTLKPDVVLYEEPLDEAVLGEAVNAMRFSDVMIVGGTSLNVYPVAYLPHYFGGRLSLIINREPTALDGSFDYVLHEDIGDALEALLG
jgi:NAD-dependent deacetylase